MTAEDNKALVRRFYDGLVVGGELDRAEDLVAGDFVFHRPDAPQGRDGLKAFIAEDHACFPDLAVIAEDLIAEDDRVVARWTASGTHSGAAFLGLPATGRRFTITGIDIFRVAEGRLVELWQEEAGLSLWRQLGLLSAPPGPD